MGFPYRAACWRSVSQRRSRTVPGAGGKLGSGRSDRLLANLARPAAVRDVAPDVAQADYWARANGCEDSPIESFDRSDKLLGIRWTRCKSGADVEFHRVANNGHAWPGGKAGRPEADQPTQAWNATNEMWAFFKRHTR